ncbi:MAG: hypothetical protein Q7S87_03085 [Agitococcus sp.]|nr:hypothetical protein [Agitococcus sp.]MDO9177163.1 hypothetical protein [Agitococcus sp.]
MFVITKNQAIAKADTLHTYLLEKGIKLPSSELLNAVARMAGYSDWNAFSAQTKESAVDQLLHKHERDHAHDAMDSELTVEETGMQGFGPERYIQVASGFWLAVSAEDATDYVRVCDPLGREVVYWSANEFAEDPTCVLGALARYLNRDRKDKMPNPLKRSADKIVVADKSIQTQVRQSSAPRTLTSLFEGGVVKISVETPGEVGEPSVVSRYTFRYADEEAVLALDAERRGLATDDDLELLEGEADSLVIDWGTEDDGYGLYTKELRGLKEGQENTWIMKDGRILRFYRLMAV